MDNDYLCRALNQMKEKLLKILKYLFFLFAGIAAMVWASKDIQLSEILSEAAKMNYWFFFVSALFTLVANYSRAVRWRYLIESFGYKIKTQNLYLSVLMMYLSNLIIPRSGEVTRCGTVYKYEKIPVKKLLGTVVIERVFDVLSLLFLIVLLLFIQYETVLKLYYGSKLPEIVQVLLSSKWWWISVFASVILSLTILYLLREKISRFPLMQKLLNFLKEIKDGLVLVFKMPNKVGFFIQTVIMWVFYLLTISVCFFAYEPTESMGFSVYFSVLIAGSLGMIAPTNGGIGAWHAMVILTLGIFGLSAAESTAIAHVAFGVNLLSIIVSGAVAFVLLPYFNKKVKN